MFPTMPAKTGAHQAVEPKRRAPATTSARAKKTSVFRRPMRSARKLMTSVYSALLRMVAVRTMPMATEVKPSWAR